MAIKWNKEMDEVNKPRRSNGFAMCLLSTRTSSVGFCHLTVMDVITTSVHWLYNILLQSKLFFGPCNPACFFFTDFRGSKYAKDRYREKVTSGDKPDLKLPLKRLCILCTHLPGVCLCEEQGFNLAFLVHPNAPSIAQKCGFIDWISMQGCHLARYYCTRITGD